CLQRNYYPLTF
nr:immunoglobulin light chain junction region [Macaca mulatta]